MILDALCRSRPWATRKDCPSLLQFSAETCGRCGLNQTAKQCRSRIVWMFFVYQSTPAVSTAAACRLLQLSARTSNSRHKRTVRSSSPIFRQMGAGGSKAEQRFDICISIQCMSCVCHVCVISILLCQVFQCMYL